ncbi:MAG: ABC transporter substrate-binding protein [Planctomycetaceae bacterium]|jgi:oligopeptide transport system substrate-binding protein
MPQRNSWALLAILLAVLVTAGCGSKNPDNTSELSNGGWSNVGEKLARFPMASDGPKSLDPIRGSTVYENRCACPVMETLFQYKYLIRPFELEPLLLQDMPTVSDDGLNYTFRLKKGVHFHDDPCFPDGKGREMVAADVLYSWKRTADESESKVSWLFEDTILGFNEYRESQKDAEKFDLDADLQGLRIVNDHEFTVTLAKPASRFLWTLAMFQTSVIPREAVDMYGSRFGLHPVGTGPFILKEVDWRKGQSITFRKNPNYHECYYPDEHMPEDEAEGFHKAAGQRLPLLDAVEITFEPKSEPMWLNFKNGKYDFITVPAENFDEAFNRRTKKLRRQIKVDGIRGYPVPLLDFIFKGFNMEDPVLGGYTDEKKKLRQALCLAMDWDEVNEAFYNGLNIVYDGPIPPGLKGYPDDGQAAISYRGLNLDRAKELLAEAGYPDGEGLAALDYYTGRGANSQPQTEMLQQHLSRINVKLNVHLVDFSTLIQAVDNKKAQFFSFAWGSDYPDAENNLALFYGPNEAPKPNHFNYKNAEYDELYQQVFSMQSSEERTVIMERMRDMVLEDCPYAGSMARTRFYLVRPRLKNFKPIETFENWFKYVDVDPAAN